MSGTSADGVDAALVEWPEGELEQPLRLVAFRQDAFPPELQRRIHDLAAGRTPAGEVLAELAGLDVELGERFAASAVALAQDAGVALTAVDAIASHGQTVAHHPERRATLQIGDPSVLANLLGVPVVGDFRLADMTLGGQGAPLVPYFDFVYFHDPAEHRGLLNLGGIANLTVLPRGTSAAAVYAFDTGPANMVLDALALRYWDRSCDAGGALAAGGTVVEPLLETLLADPYFAQPPPKSTGREHFGAPLVERLANAPEAQGRSPADLMATAAELSARSVAGAYARFVRPRHPLDVLIASGGGVHNAFLMERLRALLAPVPVHTTDAYGLPAAAKEALCFAVLAHETLNGVPTSLPAVTGARRPALLGKLCLPS